MIVKGPLRAVDTPTCPQLLEISPREHAYASYDSTVKEISSDGGIPADGLNLLIDQAKKDAKITREIPVSEIADFTILREVQNELGLR